MSKINPEHAERFNNYFEPSIMSDIMGPNSELRADRLAEIRKVARQLLADLEGAPSSPVSFSRTQFSDSVTRPELDKKLVILEELLSDWIFTEIQSDPTIITHSEIGRMIKRVADKFTKIASKWEETQNYVPVVEKVMNLDVDNLRTKYDIHQDYMAIRAMYEMIRALVGSMHSTEDYPELPVKPGNYSNEVNIPQTPAIYFWELPVNFEVDLTVFGPTNIRETPFFSLALTYGFITGSTITYDLAEFQNDVFKFIILPNLMKVVCPA